MTRFNALKNKILTVILAVPISVSALIMPVHAAVPTIQGATLPVSQKWIRNDGGDTNAAYTLTPVGEVTEYGYTFNTETAYNNGDISYTVSVDNGIAIGKGFDLIGDTKAEITFSWKKTGLYLFDLEPTVRNIIRDNSRYTYDTTAYRIRLYVEDMNTAFFTVQNLDKTGADDSGKVGEIVYKHQYVKPNDDNGNGGGSDDSGDGSSKAKDASSITEKTNTTNKTNNSSAGSSEPIGTIHEGGQPDDPNNGANNGTGNTNNSDGGGATGVYGTGDASNILLHAWISAAAVAALAVWMILRKKNKI